MAADRRGLVALIQARDESGAGSRKRSERLKQVARYRSRQRRLADARFDRASPKATCWQAEPLGASAERMPNVLAEDTWDLFRILLR